MPPHVKTQVLLYALPVATAINFFSESFITPWTTEPEAQRVRLLQSLASAAAIIYIYDYFEWLESEKKNLALNKCGYTSLPSQSYASDMSSLVEYV